MVDDVMVRPVRTYLEGAFLVSPESEPYPVSRSRALELRGNGLATFEDAAAGSEGEEAPPEPPEPAGDPATSKPTGRRGRPP
ncbi:hypothetical protein ASG52_25240 [Methylobacterium sp. Leaf456]|uniref:hypothetical protein n=1 Tax=Methylobacterium sp. Leaf456 TaxID=1736382 RepID=UPI0006FCFA71|nr:hypothetical protein [Methylobacterium sp. Leaf456]KQT55032.1 hypothetical protein ASG52_25240 [Methylobacterium sp. Leaf456]